MGADTLFEPFRLGKIVLANRIVMAPMTRHRATVGTDAPSALNAEYYRQRASAGLIISEAAQISQQGQGYIHTPGIYSEAQIEGWRMVTRAVQQAGGRIFCQLWHVGRVSHVSLQPDGALPVAPSAITANTRTYLSTGFVETSEPRALAADEIPEIVDHYRQAAINAKRAGFDGVEIHAANGYLPDQFMRDGCNKRADAYGGSIENRLRFALEIVDAAVEVCGRDQVGIRIAPTSDENDMFDSAPQRLFDALADALQRRRIAYLHAVEGIADGRRDVGDFDFGSLRRRFGNALILNNGYTKETAAAAVAERRCDLVAFGRPFISNPDLVARLRRDAPLNPVDEATVYGGDARGYLDYPTLGG